VTEPVLEAVAATRRFVDRTVVSEASLALFPAQICCLLGPSGCGKSTLLRILAGIDTPDGGEVRLFGRTVAAAGWTEPPEKRGIGLVFQDGALFPHLSVIGNVVFGLRRWPKAKARERAMDLLQQFGLAGRASAYPHQLSGGEQQRVSVARALAPEPSAILLDEPFSGLDGALKSEVREAVLAGLRGSGAAVLLVTHDREEAMLAADRLILMTNGVLVQQGDPQSCYFQPVSLAAARLLADASSLPATISGGLARTAFGTFAVGAPGSRSGEALVRPEAVVVCAPGEDGAVDARIVACRFLGADYQVVLEREGVRLKGRLRLSRAPVGDRISIRLEPSLVFVPQAQ
jgi:iron(III) transport system ATP-binding protein